MPRLPAGSAVVAVLVLPAKLDVDGEKLCVITLSMTLTRYFLTGQGRPHLCVPSHIMARGANLTWRWKTFWSWTMRRRFERSSRPCSSPRAIAARPCRTAASEERRVGKEWRMGWLQDH